eukprot:317134-Amphidinium_carterae.1
MSTETRTCDFGEKRRQEVCVGWDCEGTRTPAGGDAGGTASGCAGSNLLKHPRVAPPKPFMWTGGQSSQPPHQPL